MATRRSVLPEIEAQGVATLRALVAAERVTGTAPDPLRRLLALLPPDAPIRDMLQQRIKEAEAKP